MRKLNKKQKEILDRLFMQGYTDIDDVRGADWDELEIANDYETLYQDASRYLLDKVMAVYARERF